MIRVSSYDRCIVIHFGEEFTQVNILLGRILLLKGGLSRREVVAVNTCGHLLLRIERLLGIVS